MTGKCKMIECVSSGFLSECEPSVQKSVEFAIGYAQESK